MKKVSILTVLSSLLLVSCFNPSKPNYQYFPNMYESVGYKTYAESDAFRDGIEAQLPAASFVALVWSAYENPDANDGYKAAMADLKSPLAITAKHRADGKELYGVYCAVCHGAKGDGQGILMKREKFLGIPSYADREITDGSIYHVLMYGKNAMGSHAGQVNATERWQIAQHVMYLRNELTK